MLRPTFRRLAGLLLIWPALASHAAGPAPVELLSWLPAGQQLLAWERADLNRDGRHDALLVSEAAAREEDEGPRLLQVLLRQADGKLKPAASSTRAVKCRQCGGVLGDPFEGIRLHTDGFTLLHYGGSSWRWREDYRFAWSRRDQTWQLVAVDTASVHTSEPASGTTRQYRPPRDFGLINLTDFDNDNWAGRGQR